MPSHHLKLNLLLVALGALLLLASQQNIQSSAAPTSQQHPSNNNNNSPTTTTHAPRRQQPQDNCSINANYTTDIIIEKTALTWPDTFKNLDPREGVERIDCPVKLAVALRPQCQDNPQAKELAQNVISNLTVCAWLRDKAPIHRYNGNYFLKKLVDSPNAMILTQVTSSDAGIYECTINYSMVFIPSIDLARQCLRLYPSIRLDVLVDDNDSSPPDIASKITHPPEPKRVEPGQDVTFTCTHIDTLMSQRIDWFRSNCTTSKIESCDACKDRFLEAYSRTLKYQDDQALGYKYMRPYFIGYEDADRLIIKNISKNDVDTYGCMVSNSLGLDIRIANLTLDYVANSTNAYQPVLPIPPSVLPVQHSDHQSGALLTALVMGLICVSFVVVSGYIIFFTPIGLKLKKASPLLKNNDANENSKKNTDNRQHLPKDESPDVYNIGKSDECFIYGHFHQKNGNLMAQSMCSPTMLREKNLSISSNNYHTDESASWTKSLSSSGDNSRAFYQHTSNNTATTVPLYDPLPPSTGTTQASWALVQGSCVSNPTYGLLRPDPYATNPKWTFSRRNLEPQKIIGKGQFGEVWRYVAHQKDGNSSFVAVKKLTVRSGQEQQAKDEILKEIEIMKRVNDHPNVIKFLNTCVEPTTVLLIMEYADNGTLQTYLRKCRYGPVTSKELLKYSYHVAKGMEYIASRGIVHRDLATRNILLSKEKICKIADFGLARLLDDSGTYKSSDRNQPVPIKWMAPESLQADGTYTSKSDVFSVGVLMWEVVTLGATPYNIIPSSEVLKMVVEGKRPDRPPHCREEFYSIIERCWHQNPTERPTFEELANELEVLLQSENDYIRLDEYPANEYYNINTSKNAEKEIVASLPLYPPLDNVFADQC